MVTIATTANNASPMNKYDKSTLMSMNFTLLHDMAVKEFGYTLSLAAFKKTQHRGFKNKEGAVAWLREQFELKTTSKARASKVEAPYIAPTNKKTQDKSNVFRGELVTSDTVYQKLVKLENSKGITDTLDESIEQQISVLMAGLADSELIRHPIESPLGRAVKEFTKGSYELVASNLTSSRSRKNAPSQMYVFRIRNTALFMVCAPRIDFKSGNIVIESGKNMHKDEVLERMTEYIPHTQLMNLKESMESICSKYIKDGE